MSFWHDEFGHTQKELSMKRSKFRLVGYSSVRYKLTTVLSAERGVSAIEFALLAPVLIMALLGTVDVGRALTEQMGLSSLLRTGAQTAMAGGDLARINHVLHAAKDDSVTLDVVHVCACPENAGAAVDCSTTCAGPAPTAIYYSINAKKTFSGVLLPNIPLSRSLQVQVR